MSATLSLTLRIDSIAFGGEGVARDENGRVFFVPFTAVGDRVEVKIRELKKNFGRADLLRVIEPGPGRTEPPCPYYGTCGGCQYQHLDYETELAAKQSQVVETLRRFAKIAEPPVLPIIPSPKIYGYRNRITVHAAGGKIGYYRPQSADIVDVAACPIAMPEVNAILAALRQRRPPDGHFSLREPSLPPAAFHQVNHFLLEPLRAQVAAFATETPFTHLVEGYCGGGFFTELLAPHAARTWAIEADGRLLRDAHRRELPNVDWIEGRVEDRFGQALTEAASAPTLVLVDPPREGLPAEAITALAAQRPARIVYVSCNPATLARDAAKLSSAFTLEKVQPIDLFPRTAQIECVTAWVCSPNTAPA